MFINNGFNFQGFTGVIQVISARANGFKNKLVFKFRNFNMQSLSNQELKQIKIDNWGSYFLQRLLQLYFNEEFFDLTIKFHGCEQVLKVSAWLHI